jgi:hypothetical protein
VAVLGTKYFSRDLASGILVCLEAPILIEA